MDNREALEQQLKDLEAQKVALFDSGSADQAAVIRINEDIKAVRQQLYAQANVDIATEVRESDQPLILEVDGQEVNFRDWISEETNYQVIAIAVKQKIYEIESGVEARLAQQYNSFETERQQFRDQITNADTAADAKYNELYEQFQSLKLENTSLKFERDELKSERNDVKVERDEFERKFQAATGEIDSLKQQLELANSKIEPSKTTNLDGYLAEAMRKANEAKRAIYNVQKDTAGIIYTARFVDTDEEFTDKVIYIGKYRVLSEEEAARFRQEAESARQAELESIPETAAITEPVSDFPLQAPELSSPTIPEHTTDGEVATTPTEDVITVEERLAALEMAVFGNVKAAA